MKIAYIHEIDKNQLAWKFSKLVKIEEKEDKIIISIKKINNKIYKIIDRNIRKYKIEKVILATKLKENTLFKKELINTKIIKDKDILIYYIYEIIEYILKSINKKFYEIDIYFLVNKFSKINIENINLFAGKVKVLNIITNEISKFKKYEDMIFKQTGVNINVSNNKRKSLKNAKIIVNIDFSREELEKYYINQESIIVNIKENIKFNIKSFNGININLFDFNLEPNDNFYNKFNKLELYQVSCNKFPKISITNLIGEKGIIQKQEFNKFREMY